MSTPEIPKDLAQQVVEGIQKRVEDAGSNIKELLINAMQTQKDSEAHPHDVNPDDFKFHD